VLLLGITIYSFRRAVIPLVGRPVVIIRRCIYLVCARARAGGVEWRMLSGRRCVSGCDLENVYIGWENEVYILEH
jgi:hypothetical protein